MGLVLAGLVVPVTADPSPAATPGKAHRIDVELYIDPGCLWSWMAYRWLAEVSLRRDVRPVLRPYSLLLRDDPSTLPPAQLARRRASHRALRIIEAIDDPAAASRFYETLAARTIAAVTAGQTPFGDLDATLVAAGLPPTLTQAADDGARDERIRVSMANAEAATGGRTSIPVIVPDVAPRCGFVGPLVAPPPTGADALALWDALVALAILPGFYEVSRPRPPQLPIPLATTSR